MSIIFSTFKLIFMDQNLRFKDNFCQVGLKLKDQNITNMQKNNVCTVYTVIIKNMN